MKGKRQYLTALRRGVALGLALVALWAMGQTVDFRALGASAGRKISDSGFAVRLLAHQLGDVEKKEQALTGLGRLLLFQSSLLADGEEEILRLRQQGGPAQVEPEPDSPAGDGEDQEEPDLQPQTGEEGIVEMTGRGKSGGQYLYDEGVYLYNRTDLELDTGVFTAGKVDVELGEGPQILIVHTHGSEAYSQSDGDVYEESDPYRTTDCTHNVVKVGEEMAMVFRAHGFQVIHDTTLFDYPAYNGAYDRSGLAVEEWLEKYPTIQVVLDVHRDALVDSEGLVYKLVSEEAGEKVAQVMMVIGSDGSGAEHPRWKDNLAFGVLLQQGLVKGYHELARPMVVRNSRYNQQQLPGSLLVEVGGHGNTLSEAIAGARLWADNVARTLLTLKGE